MINRGADENSSIDSDYEITDDFKSSPRNSEVNLPVVRFSFRQSDRIKNEMKQENGFPKSVLETNKHYSKRKSTTDREEELSIAKLEALSQIENTIKMADMIKDKDMKIVQLQSENQSLQKELKRMKNLLDESKNMNKDLIEKLHNAQIEMSKQKIETENRRVDMIAEEIADSSFNQQSDYNRYLNDIIDSREKLQEQNAYLVDQLESSEKEARFLKDFISRRQSFSNSELIGRDLVDDDDIDERPKHELLKVIRTAIEEKVAWMDYATTLTRKVVKSAPNLFNLNPNALQSEFCCTEEATWANFAIALIKEVSKTSPSCLAALVTIDGIDRLLNMQSRHK